MWHHPSCVYFMIIRSQFSPAIVEYDSHALNIMLYRRYSNTAVNFVVPYDGDEYLKKKTDISVHVTQRF